MPRPPPRRPSGGVRLPTPAAAARRRPAPAPGHASPEVIVDFTVDRGLLFVSLRNLGPASAYDVTTRFDHRFHGLGGRRT